MIIDREVGLVPISIATALALESLFNLNPEEPSDFKYKREALWFNIRTLYRNLIGSIKTEEKYDEEMLVSDMLEEISILISVLKGNNVKGKNKVTLYANSHNDLEKVFPHAKIKRPETEKQIEYFKLESKVLETLVEEIETNDDYSFKANDHVLEGEDQNAIVLTHHPIDLLSRYKFSNLSLLESNTGKVKVQSQWNTKLTGGSKNPRIPFNSFTLQVFGDNSTNFFSRSLGYKSVLLDLAKTSNWNSLTGTEKLINDMIKVKVTNPVVYELFEKLLRTKMFF